MKLTRDQIVAEAILLLNEGGLAEVSLRKVAARVGARAPSLASHVGDKERLLTLMTQRLFNACITAMPKCATWQAWLTEFGLSLWDAQSRTRDAARLIAMAAPDREELAATIDSVLGPLVGLGLRRDDAIWMQSAVQALITGWTTFAQGADSDNLSHTLSIEAALRNSLAALVDGFDVHARALSQLNAPSC